jgi:hypothetical protein
MRAVAIGFAGLILAAMAATGCGRLTGRSKAAVQAAIEEHLRQQPGLQMQNMTMQMQNVRFHGDAAEAEVKYVSRQSSDIYVQIRYRLRKEGGRWEVQSSSLVGGMSAEPHPGSSPGPPGTMHGSEPAPLRPGNRRATPAPQASH